MKSNAHNLEYILKVFLREKKVLINHLWLFSILKIVVFNSIYHYCKSNYLANITIILKDKPQ